MCIRIYTYSSQYGDAGWAKEIKNGMAVNAACQGSLSRANGSSAQLQTNGRICPSYMP
jgi:hypothetical protein